MDAEERDALALTRDELVARFEAAKAADEQREATWRLLKAADRACTGGGRELSGTGPPSVAYDQPARLEAVDS